MKSPAHRSWLPAAEAARLLGVSRQTLYAYVSRGYIHSQASAGSSRERLYAGEDIERLRRRSEERRSPDRAAARALQWGMPVLESSISLIDGRSLYYRGVDAATLARTRSVEEVAALIWTGRLEPPAATGPAKRRMQPGGTKPFVTRAQTALVEAAAGDPLALDLRAANVALTGHRILRLLVSSAIGSDAATESIDAALGRHWRVGRDGFEIVRAALILCADHELNVSSFTARCVASAGSHPYAVVIAGLCALEGPRHGGASARVEAMLDTLKRSSPLPTAVRARLRRGEAIEGFGHPLYSDGDPRARALLGLLAERYATSAEYRFVNNVAAAARSITAQQPNLDFALAAVARVLKLPAGAPIVLFAIGRSIGWIGHAIEQYATAHLIRPRAKYVGVTPG
jgi:citrate synthase